MGKEIITQVQETQRVPNRINPRSNTARHILIILFEGNPVDEGTTGRSTDAPVHLRKTRRFHTQLDDGPETP